MFDFQATFDVLTEWGGFLRNHVPVEHWPNPVVWSGVAVLAGLVLAFWGSRLLRAIYVMSSMVVGGLIGVQLAGVQQVDRLIGLVVGAGAAALLAFLCFRWWVGLTTGLVGVLILIAAGAPRLQQEFTGFNDYRQGVGTGDYSTSLQIAEQPSVDSWSQAKLFLADFVGYLREQRRDAVIRTGVGLGLVWLLGTAAGLLMPRLVTVIGTSIGGMVLLAGGAWVLLSTRWPSAWQAILVNKSWFMAGWAVLFLAALSYQSRYRRAPVPVSAPVPAAA